MIVAESPAYRANILRKLADELDPPKSVPTYDYVGSKQRARLVSILGTLAAMERDEPSTHEMLHIPTAMRLLTAELTRRGGPVQ